VVVVKIVSAAGIYTDRIRRDAKAGTLKLRAMRRLHIWLGVAGRYWLRLHHPEETIILDDSKTLGEQGAESGATLYLETAPPRVGRDLPRGARV